MGAAENPPPLTDLERQVMERVWDGPDEVTVRDVLEQVNSRSEKARAYTTLMTIMSRLEAKEMLIKKKGSRADLFSASIGRQEYLESRAKVEVDAIVGEYGEIARALFMREIEEADPEAMEKLRQLADGNEPE